MLILIPHNINVPTYFNCYFLFGVKLTSLCMFVTNVLLLSPPVMQEHYVELSEPSTGPFFKSVGFKL